MIEKENTFYRFLDLFRFDGGGQMVNPEEIPQFEREFLYPLSILGVVLSLLYIIAAFAWNFDWGLKVIILTAFFFYLFSYIYFATNKRQHFEYVKWVFVLSTIVFINFSWYFDHRSNGPMLYLLFLLYGYLVFMLSRTQLLSVSFLLLFNLVVLFFLDYGGYLTLPQDYNTEFSHVVGSYFAVVLYTIIAFILMKTVNRIYMKEYNKALESDRLKTSFLANISHEIRTPLNAIVGFSNLMLTEEVTSEERKSYKAIINQNNKFLLELVNDILDISMIESNNVQREDELNNLNLIFADLEKAYTNTLAKLEKDQIRLVKSVLEEEVLITIDGNYLERALRHLLDNAVKFTEEGEIEFGFSVDGNLISFFVKDTGIGIKEKDKKMLFERFNKYEYSKERFQTGTGIGLYLVKLIVTMFGGNVFTESTFGEGSTFGFTIPAKDLKITKEY